MEWLDLAGCVQEALKERVDRLRGQLAASKQAATAAQKFRR